MTARFSTAKEAYDHMISERRRGQEAINMRASVPIVGAPGSVIDPEVLARAEAAGVLCSQCKAAPIGFSGRICAWCSTGRSSL